MLVSIVLITSSHGKFVLGSLFSCTKKQTLCVHLLQQHNQARFFPCGTALYSIETVSEKAWTCWPLEKAIPLICDVFNPTVCFLKQAMVCLSLTESPLILYDTSHWSHLCDHWDIIIQAQAEIKFDVNKSMCGTRGFNVERHHKLLELNPDSNQALLNCKVTQKSPVVVGGDWSPCLTKRINEGKELMKLFMLLTGSDISTVSTKGMAGILFHYFFNKYNLSYLILYIIQWILMFNVFRLSIVM